MKFPTYIHTIGIGWLTRPRQNIIPRRSVCTLILVVAACVAISPPASSQVYYGTVYSGASTGSNGTVYGWGVTDVWYTDSYHTARITTWLASPGWGRYVSGGGSAYNFKRADLSLPFDANYLGEYTASSTHDATCIVMGPIIISAPSNARTTVPYVVLSLRNTFGQSVSNDNNGRIGYYTYSGAYALGSFQNYNNSYWQTGVEIVGTVYPTSYTGTITLHRQIVSLREYYNTTTPTLSMPPCPNPACDDTSPPVSRDDYPQSGGSAGKVYESDAPGLPPLGTENTYDRLRVNFREYAMAAGVATQVSGNFYWWSRLSVHRPTGQLETILKTDVPGDNVSGLGTTKVTWNLQ